MQVDFYILDRADEQQSERFSCRLIEVAFNQKQSVFINTPSPTHAARVDELLWTFNDISFIPHQRELGVTSTTQNSTPQSLASIRIGGGNEPTQIYAVLINLASNAPIFYQRFERVLEVVASDELAKQRGRERFAWYRAQGITPQVHQIKAHQNGVRAL